MNKNLIIVSILIALMGGGFIFVKNNSDNKQPSVSSENSMERLAPSDSPKSGQSIVNSSRYVEYSNTILEQNSNKRRVLYFYASWCPTCRPADADFKANSGNFPDDVVVLRVNYNDPETDQEEKDLAKKYNVTYQHTFVQIDSAGNEVIKWNGGQTDDLLSKVK